MVAGHAMAGEHSKPGGARGLCCVLLPTTHNARAAQCAGRGAHATAAGCRRPSSPRTGRLAAGAPVGRSEARAPPGLPLPVLP